MKSTAAHHHHNFSHRPGVLAWLCCFFSLLFMGWTAGGVFEIAESIRKQVCAERIRIALDNSNQDLARLNLDRALRSEGVSGWLTIDDVSESDLEKYIVMAFDVIVVSEAFDFRSALNRIEVMRAASSEVPELRAVNSRFSSLVEESKPYLESLSFLNEKRISKSNERSKLLDEKRKLTLDLSLIAKDFADFFSLTPAQRSDDTELLLYREGILKDLPRVVNLEDGIESLPKLAKAVEYARGKVQVEEGGNAHALFNQKMRDFRSVVDPIRYRDERINRSLSELESYLASNAGEMKRIRMNLKSTLWQVLFDALDTSRRPSNAVFAAVSNTLESFFF